MFPGAGTLWYSTFMPRCRVRSAISSHYLRVALLLMLVVLVIPGTTLASDPIDHNNYALQLIDKGEYEKGLEQLQQAFSLYPLDPALRKNLAFAYAYTGKKQLERNRYADAATNFGHARDLFPDDPIFWMLRGIALYEIKDYTAAAYELERSHSLGMESKELFYYLGKVHYDTDQLADALEAWERALTVDPGDKVLSDLVDKTRREQSVQARMGKGFSARFAISYDTGARSALADDILSTLEDAYTAVGSDLDYHPQARIQVILYTSRDYRTITESPDWSGGLYDGKIRLPIGGATELSTPMRAVLFHEYAHVVVSELTNGNCPTWLTEGLAEIEGRKQHNPPMAELGKSLRGGKLLPIRRLEKRFTSLEGKQVVLAYQQSYAFVNFIITRYGWHKIREILVALGQGVDIVGAFAQALGGYGLDYDSVIQAWEEWMKSEYGETQP